MLGRERGDNCDDLARANLRTSALLLIGIMFDDERRKINLLFEAGLCSILLSVECRSLHKNWLINPKRGGFLAPTSTRMAKNQGTLMRVKFKIWVKSEN